MGNDPRLAALCRSAVATAWILTALSAGPAQAAATGPVATSASTASAGSLVFAMGGLFGAAEEESSQKDPDPGIPGDPADGSPPAEDGASNPLALLSLYLPAPGDWNLVPGTAFETVRLSDSVATSLDIKGTDGSRAVLNNQNGGAYDPDGHRLYFWGGGGTSYGGNEIYELNLETLEFTMLTTPSALDALVTGDGGIDCPVPSGAPAAGSTFDGLVWSSATQTLFVYPTGNFCLDTTASDTSVWEFDPADRSWTAITAPGEVGGHVMAEYDPITQRIVVVNGNNANTIMEMDPATGVHSAPATLGQSITKGSAVLRPLVGDLLLLTEDGVISASLENLGDSTLLATLETGVGAQSGAAYDTNSGLLVLWGGGTDVITFNPAVPEWTTHTAGTGPAQQGGGVYSKWIYLPELDAFAGYNNVDEGLWLYRLPVPDTGGGSPDTGGGSPDSGGGSTDPGLSVTGLTLIDAGTDSAVGQLLDGATIDLAGVGTSLNVRADVAGSVESVVFELSGSPISIESNQPYALAGDSGGNYHPWTPSVGSYQLTVTPYTQNGGNGSAGSGLTVSFTVTNSGSGGGSGSTANDAPVANAGIDQNVTAGQTVTLDGTASSDPNGDSLSYIWTLTSKPAGSSASLSNATTATPMFVADVAGTFIAALVVSDSLAQSTADLVQVTAVADSGSSTGDSGGGSTGGSTGGTGELSALAAYLPSAGGWSLVPNTAFDLVRLSYDEANAIDRKIWGRSGSHSVLSTWNGAAFDDQNNIWYFHGGGHADYGGNEVYSLNLETLQLSRLTDPAPLTDTTTHPYSCALPATGPASSHTYNGLVWSPITQTFFNFSRLGAENNDCNGGYMGNWLTEFDPATNTWTRIGEFGGAPTNYPSAGYDETTDRIVVVTGRSSSDKRLVFNPVTRAFEDASGNFGWLTSGGAFTYNGEIYLMLGQPGRLAKVSASGAASLSTVTTLPDGLWYEGGGAVSGDGRFVFWTGGSETWTYDPASDSWQKNNPSGGATPTAGKSFGRVFSKWIYLPELDAFAGYTNTSEGLWLYCLPEGCNPAVVADTGGGAGTGDSGSGTGGGGTGDTTGSGFAVSSLTLVDAATDTDIRTLTDGETIDLAVDGGSLNIRANVQGTVESVVFQLDGTVQRVESGAPYSIAGDAGGDYAPWTPALGLHLLTAIPYDQDGGLGTAGNSHFVSFTVVDSRAGSGGGGDSGGSTGGGGSGTTASFAELCAGPNVIECVDFDSDASIAGETICGKACPEIDKTVAHSGAGSLKFTIPSESWPNSSGAFDTRFDDIGYGESDSLFISFRYRRSAGLTGLWFNGGFGMKILMLSDSSACQEHEIVIADLSQRGIWQGYHTCGIKDGGWDNWQKNVDGNWDLQPPNRCWWKQEDGPTCTRYQDEQWVQVELEIHIGTAYPNDQTNYCNTQARIDDALARGIDNTANGATSPACSVIRLWVQNEGEPMKKVIELLDHDIYLGSSRFKNAVFTPFHTGKDASQVHPEFYVWYDDLVVSTSCITSC